MPFVLYEELHKALICMVLKPAISRLFKGLAHFIDEPMNGLDKQGVADMRKLLTDLKNENKIILLASHNKEDIDILCDTVYEIDQGRILQIK